jgi:hypothetical protein
MRTATLWDRVWIDNWIYWTQLNYTTCDYTLQFTVRHTNLLSLGVFSLVVTSQLSHNSSGPRTSCRPTYCLRAHWLTAIPMPQPGGSIHPLARTHWLPNQDCNSGGPVHRFLVTVFQYHRFLSFQIHWHIYAKMVTLEGPFTLTTATETLLCRQSSSLLSTTLLLLTNCQLFSWLWSLGTDPVGNTALTLLSGQPLPSNAFFAASEQTYSVHITILIIQWKFHVPCQPVTQMFLIPAVSCCVPSTEVRRTALPSKIGY